MKGKINKMHLKNKIMHKKVLKVIKDFHQEKQ